LQFARTFMACICKSICSNLDNRNNWLIHLYFTRLEICPIRCFHCNKEWSRSHIQLHSVVYALHFNMKKMR
jgi:hypothetical protein